MIAGTIRAQIILNIRDPNTGLLVIEDQIANFEVRLQKNNETPEIVTDFLVVAPGVIRFVRDLPKRGKYRAAARVTTATPDGAYPTTDFRFVVLPGMFEDVPEIPS